MQPAFNLNNYTDIGASRRRPICSLDKDETHIKMILDIQPASVDGYIQRDDEEWASKATYWKQIKQGIAELEAIEKTVRGDLIAMACDKNVHGGGIKVSKHVRKSNIDYSIIPELFTVNLEKYRKGETEYWKIS